MKVTTQTQTLKNLLKGLKKTWLLFICLLVGLTIVFSLAAHWYSGRQTGDVEYKATTKVLITPNKNQEMDGSTLQVYLNTEKSIISSGKFEKYLQKSKLKPNLLNKEDLTNYQIENDNGTSIISIHEINPDKKKALAIVNYVAKTISRNPMNMLQEGTAQVIGTSDVVQTTSNRNMKKVYLFAFVFALFISMIIALVMANYSKVIYDAAIIHSALSNANIYEVSKFANVKDVLDKFFRKTAFFDSNNVEATVIYFNNADLIKSTLLSLLPADVQTKTKLVEYTNEKNDKSNDQFQQLSTDSLYHETLSADKSLSLIDCSKTINVGSGKNQILIVKDGSLLKSELNDLVVEFNQITNLDLYVIYYNED
ncbi:YveK family protein [Lapidilactobacillus wuchangensis]|uniref:hypothetical protein n=1 Tax=Lapidilactobacillus wuchangensis TaxID=2486001 RepID=UPI000F7B2B30|nr:hypothetical protein [Lapidilactobacillus wuchangensis]